MIIEKLDVIGIALTEFEADTPSLMAAAPSVNFRVRSKKHVAIEVRRPRCTMIRLCTVTPTAFDAEKPAAIRNMPAPIE